MFNLTILGCILKYQLNTHIWYIWQYKAYHRELWNWIICSDIKCSVF